MSHDPSTVRVGEILGALTYALDVTEGQPRGHCVRACHVGMAIGRRLGMTEAELADLYYAILLKDLGCSSNAARICALYLTDDQPFKREFKKADGSLAGLLAFALVNSGTNCGMLDRFRVVFRGLRDRDEASRALTRTRCERGAEIATSMGFGGRVADAIRNLDERWDGLGRPNGLAGTAIPRLSRIALAAQTCDVFLSDGGPDMARREVLSREGTWFDPDIAQAFRAVAEGPELWSQLASADLEVVLLAQEPAGVRRIADEDHLDDIARAFAQVIDAKSPHTAGHSARVADLAFAISGELHYTMPRRRWLRRAALLHDIGKLGISSAILDKTGRLDAGEIAIIRRHPMLSEDIVGRVAAFRDMLPVVSDHHEKLDGGGYPRGLAGWQIGLDTRIVTVADIFEALTADRPYRRPLDPAAGLAELDALAGAQVDPVCVTALKAALERTPALAFPAERSAA